MYRLPPACSLVLAAASFLPLPAQVAWTALTPANAPPPRAGHAMAYDAGNDRVVLFGGFDGVNRLGDTWLWDGTDWAQVTPATSPSARAAHPMAYDLGRGRVVLFGGIAAGTVGDTWEWDGLTWTQVFPATVPPQRRSQPMVYHPGRGTVVMWGGYNGSQDINDTWEWNGVDWSQIVTANAPSPRRASEMAYDSVGGGIVLFSGYLQPADTWYFDGTNWSPRAPATVPPGRYDHTMATDLIRGRVVMFGGTAIADTWEWDGANWLQRQPPVFPQARFDDYLAYDLLRNRTIMFGGILGVADTWAYGTTATATYQSFGAGCPGSNGLAPRLRSLQRPWIGESFDVVVDQLPAGGSLTLMAMGFSNTVWGAVPLPLDLGLLGLPGCSLLVEPFATLALINTTGSVTWTLNLPNSPSLAGASFYNQMVSTDPTANPGGATVSNGGAGVTGAR